jgi:hypothetical protein
VIGIATASGRLDVHAADGFMVDFRLAEEIA